MTLDEFDKTTFIAGDRAVYDKGIYPIVQVDFKQQLLGIIMSAPGSEPGIVTWVRCENVELIKAWHGVVSCIKYVTYK